MPNKKTTTRKREYPLDYSPAQHKDRLSKDKVRFSYAENIDTMKELIEMARIEQVPVGTIVRDITREYFQKKKGAESKLTK